MSPSSSPHQTLWDMIKDIRFGMLTHRHPGGLLHAHPVTTQNKSLDEGSHLYFFLSKKNELGQRIQTDGNVNLSYADPGKDQYVSISGQARVSHDQATKDRLFNALSKAWFPGGASDPDLELVEVSIEHAEFWNVEDSKVTQLFKIAKAAATGEPPKIGEHQALHFGAS